MDDIDLIKKEIYNLQEKIDNIYCNNYSKYIEIKFIDKEKSKTKNSLYYKLIKLKKCEEKLFQILEILKED